MNFPTGFLAFCYPIWADGLVRSPTLTQMSRTCHLVEFVARDRHVADEWTDERKDYVSFLHRVKIPFQSEARRKLLNAPVTPRLLRAAGGLYHL